MCVRFKFSETVRERLGIVTGVLHLLLALFGLTLICFSIYMKVRIESKMLLLENYSSDTLPYFLISVGCLMFVIHSFGTKISFDCASVETRQRFRNVFVCFFVTLCVLSLFVMAAGCMCFAHRGIIQTSLHQGLYTALKMYKSDQGIKAAVDRLQLDFRCCGSKIYSDWFHVSWVSNKYLNTEHENVIKNLRDGELITDSVPFSCCSVMSPRPCIHNHVNDSKIHKHYSDVTLYKHGCTSVLGDYFSDTVLTPAANTVFVTFGVELLVIILFRHLQTSIISAWEEGDEAGPGDAFCIDGCSILCCDGGDPNRYLRKRDRDAELAEDYDTGSGGGAGGAGELGGSAGGEDSHDGGKDSPERKKKDKKTKGKEKQKSEKKKDGKSKKKGKDSPKKNSSPKSAKKGSKKPSPKSKGGFRGKARGRR
ncbi:photoreceptor outer segment membrane glycoprotein 2-like isoform X2 [Haliotis rubra]|uniref:photoreceptor outer segment membrane glycoprotein 2-like isoform X2 n=1 Tax=Haliotis rubra TaxID=36100 RepID=UPI001EE56138|nr:photoreceptor outer segment membrane glycoprotein 2-like isoform X2 [Haliotis rubra]